MDLTRKIKKILTKYDIDDYRRRLKTVTELLETSNNSGSINDTKKFARLSTKAGEFRTIIAELEKQLNN